VARPCVCSYGKVLKDISLPNKFRRLPDLGLASHGSRIGHIAAPIGVDLNKIFAHSDCACNQVVAATNRVMFNTGQLVIDEAVMHYKDACRKLGRSLGFTAPITYEEFLGHYTGAKRKMYTDAVETVRSHGVRPKDAECKMFIKSEKTKFTSGEKKKNPDPRAIQFRGRAYSARFATFLKPIEEKIYKLEGNAYNGLPPGRQIAKGLNQRQKGALFQSKWNSFTDPAGIVVDGTRFDAHVTKELQEGEHMVYQLANPTPEFRQLLQRQIKNIVKSAKGVSYEVMFRRMSGDMNTAVGNCLIMVMIIVSFFNRYFPGVPFQLMDDGDDCIIIVERKDKDRIFPLIDVEDTLFYKHCSGLFCRA